VYDALHDPRLVAALVRRAAPGLPLGTPSVRPLGVEQTNSSVVVDERYLLKVFRRPVPGPNRDLTLHRTLADAGCPHVPPLLGAVEDDKDGASGITSGITYATLQRYLPDAVDGWALALDHARDFRDLRHEARALGQAVAAVHRELAAAGGEVPLRRADYRRLSLGFLRRLDRALETAPQLARHTARLVAEFRAVARPPDRTGPSAQTAQLIHGDLHLGQTLRTPEGWLVIDFEGEPMATPEERDRPDSPLRDLAGMLRSFDYAAHHQSGDGDERNRERAARWAGHHQRAFWDGYAAATGRGGQRGADDLRLLNAYVLDKAVYEVAYEVQHRPAWAWLPRLALDRMLAAAPDASAA
jgi:maltokinase